MPSRFIAGGLIFLYHLPMERLLQTLENIGICPETIKAIRVADDIENALILIMDDDRHEYVD